MIPFGIFSKQLDARLCDLLRSELEGQLEFRSDDNYAEWGLHTGSVLIRPFRNQNVVVSRIALVARKDGVGPRFEVPVYYRLDDLDLDHAAQVAAEWLEALGEPGPE